PRLPRGKDPGRVAPHALQVEEAHAGGGVAEFGPEQLGPRRGHGDHDRLAGRQALPDEARRTDDELVIPLVQKGPVAETRCACHEIFPRSDPPDVTPRRRSRTRFRRRALFETTYIVP